MKKALVCFFLLLSIPLCVRAQVANTTELVGNAVDPSGKQLVGATVTAIEQTTKVSYTVTTNGEGFYSVSFILPGTYDITVKEPGFSELKKIGVVVSINQASRTDFALKVGSDSAIVSVNADTPPMPTDDATLGETFDSRAVQDLPVQGHNAMDIATMASNVEIGGKTNYSGTPPGEDLQGAGQREIQNIITVDGVSILNDLVNTTPAHPTGDMINEVQMQSGNYTAQYGGYLGIHVNMTTRNGTNALHGSAYDYIRNTFFNAYPYSFSSNTATTGSSTSSILKPPMHINEFGATFGGPLFIPKVYDGRDKTFVFVAFDKFEQIATSQGNAQTIPPAFFTGDFSLLGGYNPTTNTCTGTCLVDPSTGAYYPNNQITASELQTPSALIAKKIEPYFAAPTSAGYLNNLSYLSPNNLSFFQIVGRVDEQIGPNDRLFVRYYTENLTFLSPAAIPANTSSGPTDTRNWAIGYAHFFTPNLINDFHLGFFKMFSDNLNYFYTHGLNSAGTQLGIPGFNGDTKYGNPGFPCFNVSGYQVPCNSGSNWFQDDRNYDLFDQVTYSRGKHQIAAGVEFHRLTLGREATNNPDGAITFSATTAVLGSPGVSTGFAPADFVLGYVNNDTIPIDTIKGSVKQWRDGIFAMDTWRATPRLTISYGVHYDLPLQVTSLNGYGRKLNPAQTALIPSTSATLAANYAPVPGFQFTPAQKDNIGPRLGLAYRATDKFVLRGGAGFYYEPNQLNTYTLMTSNYPFAAAVTYNTTVANTITLANPTPGSGTASTVAGTPGTYLSAYTPEEGMKTQRAYQWNADLGYSLWQGAAFEAQYQGSRSLHLDRSYYDNQPVNPKNVNFGSPYTINNQRPNQLWGDIRQFQEDDFSTYHALTTIIRQRESHGLSGQVSYTWAHDIDLSADSNGGGTVSQQYNPKADYGDANWDIRNRIVAAFTYAMPKLNESNPVARELLGGWHVNGVINLQSGTPYNISMSSNTQAAGVSQGTQRPSWNHFHDAHCTLKNSYYTHIAGSNYSCIDETAFTVPVNYTSTATSPVGFGNIHRNTLHGPGFDYQNLSAFKDFQLYQRLKFQFQVTAYNVFNHPSAGNPNSGGIGICTANAPATSTCPASSAASLNFVNTSFGQIDGVQSTPGQPQGARVIELSGKIVF